MTRPKSPTAAQRKYFNLAVEAHKDVEQDFDMLRIPEDWHEIWKMRVDHPDDQEKIEIFLDKKVVRFFRTMGEGYGPRMNRVLRAFMYDRLSGVVGGPEARTSADAQHKLDELQSELQHLEAQRDADGSGT